MRFAGAVSVLAFGLGASASAQDAVDREQQINALQKQLDSIAAQLRELQGQAPVAAPTLETRLDGAVRQSPAEALREPRRLNISAPGLDSLDVSGMLHFRGEYWGNYNAGAGTSDGVAFGTEASLTFDAKVSENTHVVITPQASFVWGDNTVHNLTGGPFGTGGFQNSDDVQIVEAFLGVNDLYGTGWNMSAGRQRVQLGNESMIGDDEWNLNRTTFDGFRLDRDLGEPGNLTVLLLRVEDLFHASSFLAPTSPDQTNHGELYSIYWSSTPNDSTGQFDVYVFHLENPGYGSASNDDRTRWTTYGGRWASANFGGLTFDAEAVTQFGEYFGLKTYNYGGSIYALHAGANFKPENVDYFDGVVAAYDYASGGDNNSGIKQENFVQLYPTLHNRFGLMDFFSMTNIQHWMLGTNFKMTEGTLMLAYHWTRMASAGGGFIGYNQAGGASTDGKDLGQEADLVYSVQCTKSTAVDMGLGYFFPGNGYDSATGTPNQGNVTFGYLQFSTRF